MENGDYTCKRRRLFGRKEHKYTIDLPTSPAAEVSTPINNDESVNPSHHCPYGDNTIFCTISNSVDRIYFCPAHGDIVLLKECAPDETCVGRPHPLEQDPRCVKQTTTIHSTSKIYSTSSWDGPFPPERPLSSYDRAVHAEATQTLVATPASSYHSPTLLPTRTGRLQQSRLLLNERSEPELSDTAALINDNSATNRVTRDTSNVMCGLCINMQGRRSELTGVNVCNTLADDKKYRACSNLYCGICIIFDGKDCQGRIIHWGGPGEGSYDATGGQSHFCL
ncbi:hypothetical protein BKA66DRAFT_571978 [Pyrenochaeta sp. MPI-SDFR-AT-0127]|nr:hypothetical protein BKA66DRAFT_571978 [Pyrenochaeta sp. MPI-SDFR-AT-0127]